MRLYLAGPWPRREEIRGYAKELRALGIEVTSRWLNDGIAEEGDLESPPYLQRQYALIDLLDIEAANALVAFTEANGSECHTGGRHIEAGYAIAKRKIVIVVGPLENVFYHLPQIRHFNTFDELKEHLSVAATFLN